MGIVSEITLRNQGFTIEEVVEGLYGQATQAQVAQDSPLLSPFTLVAPGLGYNGERPFAALVIVHENATAAEANLKLLLARMRDVTPARRSPDWALPWPFQVDRVGIRASGRFLIARIFFTQPQDAWLMDKPNSLLVHE